jgi:phage baseplate assembly protein W
MTEKYYQIPIQFNLLKAKNKDLSNCCLMQSLAQNIYMIISSKFQEHRFDHTYGCELWDMDFELITNESQWLEKIRKSILFSVCKYEKRLDGIVVKLKMLQEELEGKNKNIRSIKKKLEIRIEGKIMQTGEPYFSVMNIYLSPLSLD